MLHLLEYNLLMISRLFFPFLCAFLLAFAQQEAALHPYVHTAELQQKSFGSKSLPHHQEVCGKCAAVTNLGAAVGSQALLFDVISDPIQLSVCLFSPIVAQRTFAYLSRAPPILT